MAVGEFNDVTWGSVRLWCSRLSTTNGRSIVVHELAEGDDHPTQDRGLAPRRVSCDLLFIEMPSEPTAPLARFQAFKAQVDDGEQLLFSHPIDPPFYARVEDFTYDIDEDGNFASVTCTFIKSGEAEAPRAAGAGATAAAGEDAIAARAAEFDAEIDAVGIESTLGDDAIAAQGVWAEAESVPTRQIIVDVAGLSARMSAFIEDEQLEHDLALFAVFRASILLGAAIRAAALAALAETPRLTAVLVATPISLLALCVRMYGGLEAEDRTRQVLALNDLRSPAWIDPGTIVMMPVPSRSRALRRVA